mgnify:CR=1 FL=1
MKALRALLLFGALLAGAPQAQALCLLCSCTASTTPVAFGAYNPIGGAAGSGSGNVHVSCTGTVGLFVDYSISLGKGAYGATYNDRQMANGAARLTYQLYGDSGSGGACSVVWGDGTGATSTVGGSLLIPDLLSGKQEAEDGLMRALPHFAPKAKRIIYLFQNGAPSQLETFDYKPLLRANMGQGLPESIRMGQRLTGMTAGQSSFPLVGSYFDFNQYGQSRAWISSLFPHIASVVDDLCIVKSMHTEAINHDPALTFFQTGAQVGNRPSMGSWLSYGLGSENANLPAFCVLLSRGKGNGQGVYSKLWSNGFLDATHQGVQFSNSEDPVLYLKDPSGMSRDQRRKMIDQIAAMNDLNYQEFNDPQINAKVQQYEMAFRMQASVPGVMAVPFIVRLGESGWF